MLPHILKTIRRTLLAGACITCALGSAAYAQEPTEVYGKGANAFSLATGSPGELNLLRKLGEAFASRENASLRWFKAGTGQSMAMLKDRKVDMIMVHAPDGEQKAVDEGWATERTLIGSNEFYIVGPAADPASLAAATSAADAYQRIAAKQARFVSRGDNSGTHQKEITVWKAAGIAPAGDWYIVTKAFMTASLQRAEKEGAYFMTDSSTWVAERKNLPGLKILYRGDKALVNTYHAMAAPAGATPGRETAVKFIRFVASPEGQQIIGRFGAEEHGEGLYNDAAYAKQYVR